MSEVKGSERTRRIHPEASRRIDRELFWATHKGDKEQVLKLLDEGACCQYLQESDPMECAMSKHLDIARIFLERGADPNKRDISGHSLFVHNKTNVIEAFELLLEFKADVNGIHLLHQMSFGEFQWPTEALELLLRHGLDVHSKNEEGRSPLHDMVSGGHLEMVDFLLKQSVNVNELNKMGQTPLHLAASEGFSSLIPVFLAAGCDIEAKDFQGLTPFMVGIQKNSGPAVSALLAAGADPHVLDQNGKTAREVALRENHQEVLSCLDANKALSAIDDMLLARHRVASVP